MRSMEMDCRLLCIGELDCGLLCIGELNWIAVYWRARLDYCVLESRVGLFRQLTGEYIGWREPLNAAVT